MGHHKNDMRLPKQYFRNNLLANKKESERLHIQSITQFNNSLWQEQYYKEKMAK